MEKKFMKIGELVKCSGVPKTTIRYYINNGLLPDPVKTSQTMAYYDERHVKRLNDIRSMMEKEKLPLAALKRKFDAQEARFASRETEASGQISDGELITTEHKQKKKQGILNAAVKVFSEKGCYRTTVKDITRAADVSTGTFYFYFQDKHQLYNEVIDNLIQLIKNIREQVLRGESDFFARIVKRARAIYEHYEKYREIIYLIRAEIIGDDEWAKKKAMKLYQTLSESLKLDLQKGIDLGLIRQVDTTLTSYSLIGLIEIMILFMNLEDGYDFEHILTFLIDFVLTGLESR